MGEQLTCWMHFQPLSIYHQWASGSDLLKYWRATHSLDVPVCPAILISSSDLVLESDSQSGCVPVFSHSHQWFWSAQTLESNSLAHPDSCVFSHSCQWFWSAQMLESNSLAGSWCLFSCFCQWFWYTREWLTIWMWVQLISHSDLLRQWKMTHILDV